MHFGRVHLLIAAVAGVCALGLGAFGWRATAQQPTLQPGSAAIWTLAQGYNFGDSIQVCYTIPIPGQITITDYPPDGSVRLFFSGQSSGTSGCQSGVVTPPAGRECLALTYPNFGGSGMTRTCFQVGGSAPSAVSIRTDRSSYHVGDPIEVCYRVSGPGMVTISDRLADGTVQTFFSGFDDGTGGCIPGTITPPAGTECLTITLGGGPPSTIPGPILPGGQASAQTCFQVIGVSPVSNWTVVGSQQVVSGNWNFDAQTPLDPSLTYVRVTSGSCTDNPASTLVWEANLQRQPGGPLGVDVYTGDLAPVGLAVTSGGSGHARISRPVTLNPTTQIDLTLFQVGIINNGATFTACFRTP